MKISASFLSIKENLKENIQNLGNTSIDYLHLDIMDGKFVQNKTWNIKEIQYLVENIKKPLDVHFMVEDIEKYIEEYKIISPEFITFHLEATNQVKEMINKIHNQNSKVGISIKPNTNVESLYPYLNQIDLVLLMSVEPGLGGQKFIQSIQEKIEQLEQYRKNQNLTFQIEVDGGINIDTINMCKKADIVVVGSYITNHKNYQEQINILKEV